MSKTSRDIRRTQRMLSNMAESGGTLRIDQQSIEALQSTLTSLNKAVGDAQRSMQEPKDHRLDEKSLAEIKKMVSTVVKGELKAQAKKTKTDEVVVKDAPDPQGYKVTGIKTDSRGNIMSCEFHPIAEKKRSD